MTAPTAATALASYYALDAAYRAATARTALATLRTLQLLWRSVDPQNIAGSSGAWLDGSVQAILDGQVVSRQLANLYTERIRQLSLGSSSPYTPAPLEPPNVEQIRKSMIYTGLATTGREMGKLTNEFQSRPIEEADPDQLEAQRRRLMEEAIRRATGAAIRHVTNAGHEQLDQNVKSDQRAIGWMRTTKPGCCYFCAMLGSRGLVYKEESFQAADRLFDGPGNQKVHDNCGCGLRPVYLASDPAPERTADLDSLWGESQKQRRPDETPVQAWRRVYEASPLAARV